MVGAGSARWLAAIGAGIPKRAEKESFTSENKKLRSRSGYVGPLAGQKVLRHQPVRPGSTWAAMVRAHARDSVHLQVVGHSLVDHGHLRRGHPLDAITSAVSRPAATALSHLTPTHSTAVPVRAFYYRCWGGRPAEDLVIDDDPGARADHGRDAVHPGCL